MKLRLTQPGFETYNGQMGVIFFENGLSTADVRTSDAVRMSAVMLCEWEDGSSPNIAQSLLDNAHTPAHSVVSHDDEASAVARKEAAAATLSDVPRTADAALWTEERLAALADKEGIKGLRSVADPLGVKGNSIKELIQAILKSSPKA